MRLRAAVVLLMALAGSIPAVAQSPLEWLSGDWTERTARSKGKTAAAPPGTLHVEVAAGILHIQENGASGDEVRCRLDGMETQYRQTKPKATVDYTVECEIASNSVEVTGTFKAGGIEGFPPREFEMSKKYELAPDGSLQWHDQLWAIIPWIGRIGLSDAKANFARTR
jgi:hypothetical protein